MINQQREKIPANVYMKGKAIDTNEGTKRVDPAQQTLFTEEVPNALSPDFKYEKKCRDGATQYEIKIGQVEQQTGLTDQQGNTLSTTVWGYGQGDDPVSWPGKTIEVTTGEKVNIKWVNKLMEDDGTPLPHLLPVDKSLHWCYGLHGYEHVSIEEDGVPIVTHVHGAHVDTDSDGNPEYFFGTSDRSRGPRWKQETYHYDNSQRAAALWYHDHGLGITRLNVYAGLAGFYIVRDGMDTGKEGNPLGLPVGEYEQAYAVQDRMFKENGELFFPAFPGDPGYEGFITEEGATPPSGKPTALAEFFGDHMVVNGKIWPKKEVEPRPYRIRLLNGCDSRFMRLRFREVPAGETDFTNAKSALSFYVIGSDQGLLKKPVSVDTIDFMPAERLDLIVDFSTVEEGSRVIIENILGDSPFMGELPDLDPANGDVFEDRRTDRVMAFDVVLPLNESVEDKFNPSTFDSGYCRNDNPINKLRKVALFEGKDEFGRLQPMLGSAEEVQNMKGDIVKGSMTWHQPITENPQLGHTEIWEIYNTTGDAHPIHVHLVHFDILSRAPYTFDVHEQSVMQHNGEQATGFYIDNIVVDHNRNRPSLDTEQGPKDMVIAYPNEVTRIKMIFDKAGRYVWHCHILSHEDHDMMRPMHVGEKCADYEDDSEEH